MKLVCTLILNLLLTLTFAQNHDYHWQLGGWGSSTSDPEDTLRGITVIDFKDSLSHPSVYYDNDVFVKYSYTNATIADSIGNYLFTFNGRYIADASGEVMENGDALSDSGDEYGASIPQGGLILPLPDSKNKYILFHQEWKYIDPRIGIAGYKMYASVIDMTANEGLGAVVSRKNLLIQDTMGWGKLTATKHANGRDWWIIAPSYNSDIYYRLLVTSSGAKVLPAQSTGLFHQNSLGQAHFTPNGKKYVNYSGLSVYEGEFLYLYEFDRCSGLLSDPQSYDFYPGRFEYGSVCFSPNSDLLYLFKHDEIYQYDLTKMDVFQNRSLVGIKDDYLDHIPGTNFYSTYSFFTGQLGPDGKIYIFSYGPNRLISTIDYPDRLGESCGVSPHSVHLNTFNQSFPNFPHYRLGPVDGSPCDTLGLNNLPHARFRIDQDTSDHLKFQFIDLSSYEPEEWSWNFGDGNKSSQINPEHSYSSGGLYKVCLEVRNANGSHTSCKTLRLGALSSSSVLPVIDISLYPNPFRSYFNIQWQNAFPKNAIITVYDLKGTQVMSQKLYNGQNIVNMEAPPSGMYFYEITEDGYFLKSGKLIKL